MSVPQAPAVPFVTSLFHPTNFSVGSENAFAHALAIALIREARFTLLHAGREFLGEEEWTKFPPVRATLERWGLLEPNSPRSAVFEKFAVRVKKVNARGLSPLATSLEYLDKHPTDLLVVATEGREGLPRWLRPSVSERLAWRSGTMTLLVPDKAPGFVSLVNGEISLRRILIPVDTSPSPAEALTYAARAAEALGDQPVQISLLHVGDVSGMPSLDVHDTEACRWETIQATGDVADGIVSAARSRRADLIVMPTAGHDNFVDMLRGSLTEQVLRRAPCPLLAVPAR